MVSAMSHGFPRPRRDRGGTRAQAIVAKVNVDENQAAAQRYGILAMPTLSVFRDGEMISSVVSARPKRRLLSDLSEIL
jgi:thioredoxin 1